MAAKFPEINKIFDDLDSYRDFCRDFGYVFDEKHLYQLNKPWGQYEKYKKGHRVINNWKEDRKAFYSQNRNYS